MWKKTIFIIILFFLLAILQNSFFVHFSLLGIIPNLIFVYFFLLVFWEGGNIIKNSGNNYIFPAIIAGLLLDLSSFSYIGPSIILLIVLGFLIKNTRILLQNKEDLHPFEYYLPIFIISLFLYNIIINFFFYFIGENSYVFYFDWYSLLSLLYNSVFASLFFYIYKKWQKSIK